jgi:hypothetical protein
MRCWIRGDDDGEGGVCGGELRDRSAVDIRTRSWS